MFEKYYPIERDPSLTTKDKLASLNIWWNEDLAAFSKAGYSSADFARMALESKLLFRMGTADLFRICQNKDIDVLVASGGIHELIEISFQILF